MPEIEADHGVMIECEADGGPNFSVAGRRTACLYAGPNSTSFEALMKDLKSSPVDPIPAAFRAAHIIATHGEDMGDLDGSPEGEVVWQEDGDTVTFTPDGWLVWVSGGAATFGRRVRATPALLAELRGRPTGG